MAIFLPATSGTSGSNYNPPEADKSSKYFNVWMPVPLYLSGVVIIFAVLDLGKNISFSDNLLGLRPVCSEPCRDLQKRPQGPAFQL